MKYISKTYKTLKQAESYLNRLYSRFDYVRLVHSPRFGEAGIYIWEVSNEQTCLQNAPSTVPNGSEPQTGSTP